MALIGRASAAWLLPLGLAARAAATPPFSVCAIPRLLVALSFVALSAVFALLVVRRGLLSLVVITTPEDYEGSTHGTDFSAGREKCSMEIISIAAGRLTPPRALDPNRRADLSHPRCRRIGGRYPRRHRRAELPGANTASGWSKPCGGRGTAH